MRRAFLVPVAFALSFSSALADDAAELSEAVSKAVSGATLAQAYMDLCDVHDPESAGARRDAMAGWAYRVDLPAYYRFLEAAAGPLPDLAESVDAHVVTVREAVEKAISDDSATCTSFSEELAADKFDIERPIRYLSRNAQRFGIQMAEAPAPSRSDEIEVVPLIALSAQLTARMEEIGSKAGARENRDLRAARENHAEIWLKRHPALVAYGRITDGGELREWRGDQQSSFAVRCQSFADDENEAAMETAIGQDRIIAGQFRWISDEAEGGVLALNECRIFTHDPAQTALATISDDSAGLRVRPPEYEEAFAGPGEGIRLRDIDRVLYAADFTNRIDGFGNGYTDRREDIYVLMRDGTAYRHDWNFAFTDLDAALSRQREPDRWFVWRDERGSTTLTQTGGLDAGAVVDLSDARRLMPFPHRHRLESTFYYLNVGRGGGRSDREYAFSSNGELVHERGGFVAGNFGTSYIIVTGDSDAVSSTYVFEDYTLLIDGPDGQERHFAALIEGQDPHAPEEIIIDGKVHWLRESAD